MELRCVHKAMFVTMGKIEWNRAGELMKYLTISIGAAALLISHAQASEKLGYGSRAGMEVTVISKSGIGTQSAIIRTKHTRENAIAFCRDYILKVTNECIERELSIPLKNSVTANCRTGEFTDFAGSRYRYQGRNPGGDPEFNILDSSGQKLDGSSASGYYTNIGIYKALCEKGALEAQNPRTPEISDFYGIWSSVEDKCRSFKEDMEGPWFDIEKDGYGPGNGDESCGKAKMKLSGNALTITALCGSMEDESSKPSKRTFVYKLVDDRLTSSDGNEIYERCKKIPK